MNPLDGPIQPGGGSAPQRKDARRIALEGTAQMREGIRQGRALPDLACADKPDWDLHERRLDEIEALIRSGRREDALRLDDLHQVFMLDYQADMARILAAVNEDMVRILDQVAARHEEIKFELTSEECEGMEEVIDPYKDQYREAMLGSLPIEKRRELEAEKRRRVEAGDEPPG